jgi:hypothetical protein
MPIFFSSGQDSSSVLCNGHRFLTENGVVISAMGWICWYGGCKEHIIEACPTETVCKYEMETGDNIKMNLTKKFLKSCCNFIKKIAHQANSRPNRICRVMVRTTCRI